MFALHILDMLGFCILRMLFRCRTSWNLSVTYTSMRLSDVKQGDRLYLWTIVQVKVDRYSGETRSLESGVLTSGPLLWAYSGYPL
jgi:hypothetical protein